MAEIDRRFEDLIDAMSDKAQQLAESYLRGATQRPSNHLGTSDNPALAFDESLKDQAAEYALEEAVLMYVQATDGSDADKNFLYLKIVGKIQADIAAQLGRDNFMYLQTPVKARLHEASRRFRHSKPWGPLHGRIKWYIRTLLTTET